MSGLLIDGVISHFHCLVLITHNELTFTKTTSEKCIGLALRRMQPQDQRERASCWWLPTSSLQIGDLCITTTGALSLPFFSSWNLSSFHREAHIIFQPGKNRDGWFTADHLLSQVNKAITIFNKITGGDAQALFLFNNAPSHQNCADNALSACLMVKGALYIIPQIFWFHSLSALKNGWTHNKSGIHMCCGTLPNSKEQSFYFAANHPLMPGWFKGMEQIIYEYGLWPEVGLPAQFHEFKCPSDCTNCCCQHILYLQPDFIAQKSQLAELVESHGHICDFYLKYHCELNFIEQYWGAAKTHYHEAPRAKTVCEMENTVKNSLDKVPMIHIQRCICHFLLYFPISPSHRFTNWAAHALNT